MKSNVGSSKINALRVLSSLTFYIIRNFPRIVICYLLLKVGEIVAQLLAAVCVALIIQSQVSGDNVLTFPSVVKRVTGFDANIFLQNISMGKFSVFVGLMLLLNVFLAYLARRILARVSIRVEENLAADVVSTLKNLTYKSYQTLIVNHDFDQGHVLRLIQQNTRLTGIAGRNLLSAVFTIALLVMVFLLLFILDHRTSYVAFGSLLFASIGLVSVFRMGMRHSEEFPASIPLATESRRNFLQRALSGDPLMSKKIRSKYLNSDAINLSLKHYENRFKILDLGELITASVTSIAFISIIGFFVVGQTNDQGAELLTPFMIVAILFIGNMLFQSLRRTSTLIIAIGRLYEQVWELWEYRVCTLNFKRNVTKKKIIDNEILGKFRKHVDIHDEAHVFTKLGGVLAICQHTPVNRLGLFKALNDSVELSPSAIKLFDNTLAADLTDFEIYWNDLNSNRQTWLLNKFIEIIASIDHQGSVFPEASNEALKSSRAFQLFSYLQQHQGVLLLPMTLLKEFPAAFFALLIDQAKCAMVVVMGRSPANGLRGYENLIPYVLLNGRISMTIDTVSACMLPGLSLQSILKLSEKKDKEGVLDISSKDFLNIDGI